MVAAMKSSLDQGQIGREFFDPNPEAYFKKMSRDFEFADHLFLMFFAQVTKRDIIVLPLHPESAIVNSQFTLIKGFENWQK